MKTKWLVLVCLLMLVSGVGIVGAISVKNVTGEPGHSEVGPHYLNLTIDGNIGTWGWMDSGYGQAKYCFPSNTTLTSYTAYWSWLHSNVDRKIEIKPTWYGIDGWDHTLEIVIPYNGQNSTPLPNLNSVCFDVGYPEDYAWGFNLTEISFTGYNATWNDTAPPIADFIGTPTSGQGPLYVSFVDSTTNLATSWNWSASPASGAFFNTPNAEDTTALFHDNGNYTITHCAANSYGSDCEVKTDYIWVYNSTIMTTLHVTAVNSLNAYPIHGAQVNLYDVQNSTWSNTTTTDGTGTITALNSHTIDAYASAAGFSDNDKLGIPVTNVYDSILLFPTNITNVSAGNVTLFVSVFDSSDHSKPIVGAGVTVVSSIVAQSQFTNSGGMAQFVVQNETTVLVDVEAAGQGYQGATQSVYTGTGSGASASVTATIYLAKKTITPTVTATTLPGGGTPTATITILPGCENPMSAECQASQNDYSMGWLSQNGLMLIQFFVVCFIVFMVNGMGKK